MHKIISKKHWLSLFALTATVIPALAGGQGPVGLSQQISPGEYQALVEFCNVTVGVSTKGGWLNPDAPSWEGVTVDGFSADENGNVLSLGYVSGLTLPNSQLSGNIGEGLGGLSSLQALVLSGNQLTGSIPNSLGNLSNLSHLLLANNQLSGSIPETLGNLTLLQFFDVGSNLLTGTLPHSLSNMSFLQELILSDNQLSGSIVEPLQSLGNLGMLKLENNYFVVDPGTPNRTLIDQLIANLKIVTFTPQKVIALTARVSGDPLQIEVTFAGVSGQSYLVESSADLSVWNEQEVLPSTGGETIYREAIAALSTNRFFRVRTTAAP